MGQGLRDLTERLGRRLPSGRLPGLRTAKLVLAAVLVLNARRTAYVRKEAVAWTG